MEAALVKKINQQVYKRFPELRGANPKIQKLDKNILLIYQSRVRLPDDHLINRTIRVVADEQGEIVKMSTSK